MFHSPRLWRLAARLPGVFPGAALHQAALYAMSAGAYGVAETLFELAAGRYRRQIAVEPLARLRVHQLIARVRSQAEPGRHDELMLEVERRLYRLRRIESLVPPFEMIDARQLLAAWNRSAPIPLALPLDPRTDPGSEPARLAA